MKSLVLGTVYTSRILVSEADMETFRKLSGDENPVHFDRAYAQARKLDGPIVYGALLVSAVSRVLGNDVPGPGCIWQNLSLDFRSPLYVGEQALLTSIVSYLNEDLGVLQLKLNIAAGERLIAAGKVQALWRD